MPQFDFYSFSTQIFWVLLGFFVFYFFLLHYFLTPFSRYSKIYYRIKNIVVS